MAAKKYYAVKKGKTTGIFQTWEECRASVEGCSGAEYKGFARLEEAEAYLGGGQRPAAERSAADVKAVPTGNGRSPALERREAGSKAAFTGNGWSPAPESKAAGDAEDTADTQDTAGQASGPGTAGTGRGEQGFVRDGDEIPAAGTLLAYVDGSYDDSLKKYAFGCVFICPDGRIYTEYGNGDNAQSLRHRNVTGEMLGAMYAVKTAMMSGFSKVELCYDYEGIEKWVTGAWRSKTELTAKYAAAMREWGKNITISFRKVAAHTNVYYNELADKTAKRGLREGDGIPGVHSLA